MYGFDVKDRGKDRPGAGTGERNVQPADAQAEGHAGWQQRRARAEEFLASVDASTAGRRRRRRSGVMW